MEYRINMSASKGGGRHTTQRTCKSLTKHWISFVPLSNTTTATHSLSSLLSSTAVDNCTVPVSPAYGPFTTLTWEPACDQPHNQLEAHVVHHTQSKHAAS